MTLVSCSSSITLFDLGDSGSVSVSFVLDDDSDVPVSFIFLRVRTPSFRVLCAELDADADAAAWAIAEDAMIYSAGPADPIVCIGCGTHFSTIKSVWIVIKTEL